MTNTPHTHKTRTIVIMFLAVIAMVIFMEAVEAHQYANPRPAQVSGTDYSGTPKTVPPSPTPTPTPSPAPAYTPPSESHDRDVYVRVPDGDGIDIDKPRICHRKWWC